MSVESSLARVLVLQAWIAPAQSSAAPATAAPRSAAATTTASFADTLAQTLAAPPSQAAARAGSDRYPHLTGDLDSNPVLLERLERLAAARGEAWTITSGRRTYGEQQRLWDNRATNGFPVARPGTSSHESGNAADVTIAGRPIQDVIPRTELVAAGLAPLAGDAVHIDLPAGSA